MEPETGRSVDGALAKADVGGDFFDAEPHRGYWAYDFRGQRLRKKMTSVLILSNNWHVDPDQAEISSLGDGSCFYSSYHPGTDTCSKGTHVSQLKASNSAHVPIVHIAAAVYPAHL